MGSASSYSTSKVSSSSDLVGSFSRGLKGKAGVVRFPGSNCDRDVFHFAQARGYQAQFLWHLDLFEVSDFQILLLPGGFSYGDYLRAGALAARSPVMRSVRDFARRGGPILGICNGFQILTESGLLPGALVSNESLRFQDEWVEIELAHPEKHDSPLSSAIIPLRGESHLQKEGRRRWRLPIAHGEGRFYAPTEELKRIEGEGQVWLRYVENPNGSLNNIAGVTNSLRNVRALMPHPERALYDWMGGQDGCEFL